MRKSDSDQIEITPAEGMAEALRRIEHALNAQETDLDLSSLNLTSVPESVGQLRSLQSLVLYTNKLTSVPETLGQLSALQQLVLFGNRLTSLPETLGRLSALKHLDLSYNQLTSLPETLGQLSSLQQLDLSSNQLTSLPEGLRQLSKLESLFLHENSTLGLLNEDFGPTFEDVASKRAKPKRPVEILTYYFELVKNGRPLNEVKFLLVGRGGSGKTSVVLRLRENKFKPRQKETPGICIKPWPLKTRHGTVRVHTWDFAGQVITHATHQFFLTRRSLYLLVLTGRENSEKSDAEYWLRLIRAFATVHTPVIEALPDGTSRPSEFTDYSPVIIVLNKCKSYGDDARLKDKTVLNPQWVTNGIYTLLRRASHPRHPAEMWLSDVERELPKEKAETPSPCSSQFPCRDGLAHDHDRIPPPAILRPKHLKICCKRFLHFPA